MTRYQQVLEILDGIVNGEDFGGHGPFWRGLTRDEFVSKFVFGKRLVDPGNPDRSNLLKALKAEAPFGADVGTPGAMFNRMPSGDRPPASAEDIDSLEQWIVDGCPNTEIEELSAQDATPEDYNAYWRDFDNWAMFESTDETDAAVNAFFGVASLWFESAADPARRPAWEAAVAETDSRNAIHLLAERQQLTIMTHFGSPPRELEAIECYELFGRGTLPDDPLRSADPQHRMNGAGMWFFWSAFVDACLVLGIEDVFWTFHGRLILLGLLNDGVFRGRYSVNGFEATSEGAEAIRAHVLALSDSGVPTELARRLTESGMG